MKITMNIKITKLSELEEATRTHGLSINAFGRLGSACLSLKGTLKGFARVSDAYHSGRYVRSIHLKHGKMFVRLSHFTSPEKIIEFDSDIKFSLIKSRDENFTTAQSLDTSKLDAVIRYKCPTTGRYF